MTRISPAQRALKERGKHRIANVAMFGMMAALVSSAIWLSGWLQFGSQKDDERYAHENESDNTAGNGSEAARLQLVILVPQLDSIRRTLPNRQFAFVPEIDEQLDAAKIELANLESKLPADSHYAPTFSDLLSEIKQQAAELSSQATPVLRASQAESYKQVVDEAAKLTDVESATMALAVKTELDKRRQASEQAMRPVRLALRGQMEEAANLRERISELQRERDWSTQKEERTAALQPIMNDVRRYLTPFISPGYVQPAGDSISHNIERTVDAKPVSLAALRRIGALEPTMEGLKSLLVFGGGRGPVHANRRPLGSFPAYKNWNALATPEILIAVKRAQSLIRDHGQALVEAQLLSP